VRTAYAFLDIETVPARWREFPHALTVPPAHALLGAANAIKGPPANYSKPETIAKWWQEQTDKTPARAVKWYRGGALDPKRGEVLCIGWGLGTGDPIVLWEATERETLIALQGQLAVWAPEHIVAHGGNHFDFGFLWERATHHRLHELARWFLRVPFRHRVRLGLGDARTVLVDTAELWQTTRESTRSLVGICDHLGLTPDWHDKITGAQVLDCMLGAQDDVVRQHCHIDVVRIQRLWFHHLAPALGLVDPMARTWEHRA